MSRLLSVGGTERNLRKGAASLLLLALTGLVPLAVAADRPAKDKARGPKRRAAAVEPEPEPQTVEQVGGTDEKTDDGQAPPALTLKDVLAYLKESRAALKDVKDYTAHFSKSERIGAGMVHQEMEMKFRTKPFSVYFLYQSNNEQGRQAIYVDGRNNNNLVVKKAKGLAGLMKVSLRLDDPRVKAENLYPVTNVGIANMLEATIKTWEHDLQVPGDEVDVQFFPNAKVKGVPCQAIQVTHLKKLKELKYSKNRIYFDKETKLPIRGERFGWPWRPGEEPPLLEDYKYTNLKTNVKLTDADFDPARYGF